MGKLTLTQAAVVGLAIVGSLTASTALAGQRDAQATAAKPARDCFYQSQWRGWSAPDKSTLYMKVRVKDVYRVELDHPANQLSWPGAQVVSVVRAGNDSVCHPLDLDLRVSDGFGVAYSVRAKAITKLTPEQIQAIPERDRP